MTNIKYVTLATLLTLTTTATYYAVTHHATLGAATKTLLGNIILDLFLSTIALIVLLAAPRLYKTSHKAPLVKIPGKLAQAFTAKNTAIYATIWLTGQVIYLACAQPQNHNVMRDVLTENLISPLVVIAFITILAPLTEELLIRGLVFNTLQRWLKLHHAAILSAALFAALHGDYAKLPYTFALGMILTWLYCQANTLLAPIIAHTAFNVLALIIPAQPIMLLSENIVATACAAIILAVVCLTLYNELKRHYLCSDLH